MSLSRRFIFHLSFALFSLIIFPSQSCAQGSTLLRTDGFEVKKTDHWCTDKAKVLAQSISPYKKSALDILASEIKFIVEFECPKANAIELDVKKLNGEVSSYYLSAQTDWKIIKDSNNSPYTSVISADSNGLLSSWRPEDDYYNYKYPKCPYEGENPFYAREVTSLKFLYFLKDDTARHVFKDVARYTHQLHKLDKDYEKLREKSDSAATKIIEIASDRMTFIDRLENFTKREIAAIPLNEATLGQALAEQQKFKKIRSCLGWISKNPNLTTLIPSSITDHEDAFYNSITDAFDQVMIQATPLARDTLLAQMQNVSNVTSLEYFWEAFPDGVGNMYKNDPEFLKVYNARLPSLKKKADEEARLAKEREVQAEKKRLIEERKELSEEYDSAFLYVALPSSIIPAPKPYLTQEENALIAQHEQAQLNSVATANELSPQTCTTTRSQILYGGWASGGTTESTSCSPELTVGKKRQRNILASKSPSKDDLYAVCVKQLLPEFCKCLATKNQGHFTQEEFNLFAKSPKAYISFINERGFIRYTHGIAGAGGLTDSGSISDFMESGAINTMMQVGAERMGAMFTGIAAFMQGNVDGAMDQFRKAQLMVPSNAGDITTYCIATSEN